MIRFACDYSLFALIQVHLVIESVLFFIAMFIIFDLISLKGVVFSQLDLRIFIHFFRHRVLAGVEVALVSKPNGNVLLSLILINVINKLLVT